MMDYRLGDIIDAAHSWTLWRSEMMQLLQSLEREE